MTIASRILKKIIQDKSRSIEEILKMADVYYAAKRITEKEYSDIVSIISSSTEEEETSE